MPIAKTDHAHGVLMQADKILTPNSSSRQHVPPARTGPGAGQAAGVAGVFGIAALGCVLTATGRPMDEVFVLLGGFTLIGVVAVKALSAGHRTVWARASAAVRAARETRP
ncbi:hypothetical protein [Streptomyces lavendulocolor]|uniref:hypothetical protein n=1 Tax=Streptomyces lavendulocolor TaxID=67316 RepID=UPI003C2B1474